MEGIEHSVWLRYTYLPEKARPAASHVSAALSAFPTIHARGLETQADVNVVLQLAVCRSQWMATVDTSVKPLQLNAPLPTVPTNIGGVSAAERLVLTPERISNVVGKLITVHNHGNFTDKQQLAWGYDIRQELQPPHTQLLKQHHLDFEAFIERNGPVPTTHVSEFWEGKWNELRDVRKAWADKYKKLKPDSLKKHYWRLKERKKKMGLSL